MAINIGSAVAYLEMDSSGFVKELKNASKELENMKKQTSSAGNKLDSAKTIMAGVGSVLTKGVTLPLVGIGAASVKVGAEFESAMSQIAATMGITSEEIKNGDKRFQSLKQTAQEYGATTKFTAVQAAEGLNILAMAGLSADESIALLPDVLNLASAGSLSLKDSATYLTGAMAGFNKEGKNSSYYADLIAKGATLAKTDVNQLGLALSTASSTAQSYGQSAESVTLSLLRLAQQNVVGSEAATALNRAMMDLYTPTTAAKKAMDSLGISVYDSNGKARDFNDVISDVQTSLEGYSEEQKNAYLNTIFSTYGLQAFNKMTASTTDELDKFKDGLNNATGSAAQQAQTQMDNLKGSIEYFKSALEGAGNVIASTLIPWVRNLVDFLTKLLTAFNNLSPSIQRIIVIIGTIAAAIGPVLLIVGKAIGFIRNVQTAITMLTTAFPALGAVLSALTGPIGIVIAAVTAIGAALIYLWNHCESFREGVISVFNAVVNFFAGLPAKFLEYFNLIKAHITEFFTSAIDFVSTKSTEFVDSIVNGIKNLPAKVKNVITIVLNAVKTWGTNMINKAKETGSKFVSNIQSGLSNLASTVQSKVSAAYNKAVTFASQMKSKATEAGSGFVSNVSSAMSGLASRVSGIVSSAVSTAQSFVGSMISAGASLGSGILSGLQSMGGSIVGWASGIASSVSSVISSAVSGAKALAGRILGTKNAKGLDYVPYDGYVASLHRGEAILTKEQNEQRKAGKGTTGGDTFNFYNTKPTPYAYAKQIKKVKRELLYGF